jgi:hypothetical protein
MDTKVCSKCEEEKTIDNYHKLKSGLYGVNSVCKICRKTYGRLNYNKTKDKVLENCKIYRNNNLQKCKETALRYYYNNKDKAKLYYENNKYKINKKHNEYIKNRYNNDINFKLPMLYSRMLRHGLKNNKKYKSIEYIGCSIEELKQHLQQTALSNGYLDFDINNYSGKEYHIDHIKACANFDLTNEEHQKECFHYTNLQILDAKTNIIKSNKY